MGKCHVCEDIGSRPTQKIWSRSSVREPEESRPGVAGLAVV